MYRSGVTNKTYRTKFS